MASTKLEDGDVKGAVRLLCSDDKLAVPDATSHAAIRLLHPPAPSDRRPAPTSHVTPLQVKPSSVRKAVQSFPNGSAAGPDGLRPQHLKDLLTGATDDSSPLLVAITNLANLILEGKTLVTVRAALFGANLIAINKKNGGIRPIAVGYVWRRITAKLACDHVRGASSTMFAPRQLGFGVPGGAEAAVRAARIYMENKEERKVLIKIDFKNAFNTVRRDAILEAVDEYFPELLPFALSTMERPTALKFGDFLVESAEGAQQGDPLGPFYFCLVIKSMLESMESELVLGYLDDITMGDEPETVIKDFEAVESTAARLGLTLNRSKCEVVGHTDESRTIFAAHGILLPETSPSESILLGAPLFARQHLDATLERKSQELQLLIKRLEMMPSHDGLFLLRNVLSAPRLMFLLRTSPCSDSPVLPLYDQILRDSLSSILNIDLDDERWLQASLLVRWGGLGVRGISSLAPSAYLASAASTKELTSTLLPANISHLDDSGLPIAMDSWSKRATSSTDSPQQAPLPTTALSQQRTWDEVCCKASAERLLSTAKDASDHARLLAAISPGSGDWLNALPLSSIGLKLDNTAIRIAAGLRLGAPIVRAHVCNCGSTVTADGHHGLSCRYGSGKHSRHNQVNEILCRAFIRAGALATREPQNLCTSDGKRPDGITQVPWQRGRCLAWDATCPNTFAKSHVMACSTKAGSATMTAERRKDEKYADIIAGVDFVPVAIETSGVWGARALHLVKEIGRRIAVSTHEPRSTIFLRQQISLAVQRGNAFCVLETFPRN